MRIQREMETKNRWLSPKQVSETFGIPLTKIYYLIRLGRIVYVKPTDKLLLIPEDKFLEFLQDHTVDRR
jgi:excisionase family DNA binding protein